MHSFLAGTRERGNDECVFICNFVIKTEFFFILHNARTIWRKLLPTVEHLFANVLWRNDMERLAWIGTRAFSMQTETYIRTYDGLRDYRQIVMVSKSMWWIFWICFECLFKLLHIFNALFDVPLCYLFVWWWTLSSGSYAGLWAAAFFVCGTHIFFHRYRTKVWLENELQLKYSFLKIYQEFHMVYKFSIQE